MDDLDFDFIFFVGGWVIGIIVIGWILFFEVLGILCFLGVV